MISQQLVDILKPENKSHTIVHEGIPVIFSVHSVYGLDKLSIVIDRRRHNLSLVQLIPVGTTSVDDICKQILNHLDDAVNVAPVRFCDIKSNLINLKETLCA